MCKENVYNNFWSMAGIFIKTITSALLSSDSVSLPAYWIADGMSM